MHQNTPKESSQVPKNKNTQKKSLFNHQEVVFSGMKDSTHALTYHFASILLRLGGHILTGGLRNDPPEKKKQQHDF